MEVPEMKVIVDAGEQPMVERLLLALTRTGLLVPRLTWTDSGDDGKITLYIANPTDYDRGTFAHLKGFNIKE